MWLIHDKVTTEECSHKDKQSNGIEEVIFTPSKIGLHVAGKQIHEAKHLIYFHATKCSKNVNKF